MALSNIFHEPRREIIETVVGAILPFAAGYGYYRINVWIQQLDHNSIGNIWGYLFFDSLLLLIGIALLIPGVALLSVIAIGIHKLGESICNKLQDQNIHLRPRQRF